MLPGSDVFSDVDLLLYVRIWKHETVHTVILYGHMQPCSDQSHTQRECKLRVYVYTGTVNGT